jgi:hypothetical protein
MQHERKQPIASKSDAQCGKVNGTENAKASSKVRQHAQVLVVLRVVRPCTVEISLCRQGHEPPPLHVD